MAQFAQRFLLVFGLFALSACGRVFYSDVTPFYETSIPSAGRVSIIPMDEAKRDSIEFRQYATFVAQNLQNLGYAEAGDKTPDLVVGFDVTINDGREKLETRPSPGYSGYWTSYWQWGRFWGPYHPYDPLWDRDEIVARTVYNVTLTIEIRRPDGEKLYEARAETETRNRSLPDVVPLLAESLFKTFPGTNGRLERVKIDLSERE